jgi:hypothetical protein
MPFTKDFHLTPYGQRGGLATYPVAGVVSGAALTLDGTGIDGVDPTLAALTIGAGTVRFDGYPVSFSEYNVTVQAPVDLSTDDYVLEVFMSPKRIVPIITGAIPAASGYEEGSFIAKATLSTTSIKPEDDYYVVEQIYVKDNGAWREIRPFKGEDYPVAYGWNNMPYNGIDVTVSPIISSQPEVPVFLASKLPPHTSRPLALMRQTGSIYLGEVTYSGGTATITKTMPDYHILPI